MTNQWIVKWLISVCAVAVIGMVTLWAYHTPDAQVTYHWKEIDFDTSMRSRDYVASINAPNTFRQTGVHGPELMHFFKDLYDANAPWKLSMSAAPRVPKKIHQIWIGSAVPKEFAAYQESWQRMHPDWEYRLWTQHDLKELQLENQNLVMQSRNPAEISDLMRYEILYRYGGVYVDFDYQCLQPLTVLNYLYDFYIGIQPLDSGSVQLGSGLIGSVPGHPILRHMMHAVREAWDKTMDIPNRTGPALFTRSFIACAGKNNLVDVALPASYLYPLGCKEEGLHEEVWIQCDAFAVHHWAKSWLPGEYRRPEFRNVVS